MSRKIDTDPSYFKLTTAIIIAYPFSVIAWFLPNTAGKNNHLLSITDTATEVNYFGMSYQGGDELNVFANDGGGQQTARTTNEANQDEWNMGAGIFTSATNRRSILNADFDNDATSTTSTTPAGLDTTAIGSLFVKTPAFSNIDFLIAHVAIWNKALVDAQITALFRGVNPLDLISDGGGSGLISYWPMWGDHDPEINLETTGAGNSHHMPLVSAPAKGAHYGNLLTMQESFTFIPVAASATRYRGSYAYQLGNKQEYSHGF